MTNPYHDLHAVMLRADRVVADFRATFGAPDDPATWPDDALKPSEGTVDRATRAANVSDAASAILELSTRVVGTDTLARVAASTMGRLLKEVGA